MVLSNRALKMLRVKRRETRIDYVGAVLLTGFITLALMVMSYGGTEYPWLSPQIAGLTVATLALVVVLVVQERRAFDPLLPPRLFANSVFSRGVSIACIGSAGLFGGTFLLPLFFQLARGADASDSGAMIVPFLAFNVIGAFTSGQLARRLGKAKAIVVSGLAGATVGFVLLALMGPDSSLWISLLGMAIVGVGIGVCMPSSLVIVQNAAERRDVGAATGALLFIRSMGGALGSTMVGALLTARFTAGLAAAGITTHIDLGALRGGDPAAGGLLDSATRAVAGAAVVSGFHLAFLACAVLSGIGVLVGIGMRDLPLQSSEHKPAAIGH